MKMRIAIIDDETEHCEHLKKLLLLWGEERPWTDMSIDIYHSGEELLGTDGSPYDLIFLDIGLPGISGIDAARQLRRNGSGSELVFLTAYPEYVFEGYDVHALNYLLKPVPQSKLLAALSYVENKLGPSYFYFQQKQGDIRISYQKILYFSSSNQYVEIYTSQKIYRIRESLKNICSTLPPFFIQCHRTAIVNLYHISKIDGNVLCLLDGTTLPISRKHLADVRNHVMAFLAERM